jgi:uncharacterized protein YbjT (DUF2867 family)
VGSRRVLLGRSSKSTGLDDPLQPESRGREGVDIGGERAVVLALTASNVIRTSGRPVALGYLSDLPNPTGQRTTRRAAGIPGHQEH